MLTAAENITVMTKNTENGWTKVEQTLKAKCSRLNKEELKSKCSLYPGEIDTNATKDVLAALL
eukprot:4168542-Pyramimonas_sp.AAC.1